MVQISQIPGNISRGSVAAGPRPDGLICGSIACGSGKPAAGNDPGSEGFGDGCAASTLRSPDVIGTEDGSGVPIYRDCA